MPLLLTVADNPANHLVDEVAHNAPTSDLAIFMLRFIHGLFHDLGLGNHPSVEEAVYLMITIAVGFIVGWIIQKFVVWIVRRMVKMYDGTIGHELLQMKTISRCCRIIPPLFILAMIPYAFQGSHHTIVILMRIAGIYALVAFGIGLAAIFDFLFNHYNIHRNTRHLPMQGMLNISKGILWIVIGIIAVSVALDKSPAILLTGLGAFAAALMLVFKDSILGFVAGIQMSGNDMLHVGDWIVVPGTPANGVVLEVTLTAVKVQNFDNTFVTVPPYTLVSTSFQNYRGMSESGARRIDQVINIDIPTVSRLDEAATDAIVSKYPVLKDFVDNLRKSGKTEQNLGGMTPVCGTIDTNLGLFRAYICLYLLGNDDIAKNQQILVNLQQATSYSMPLQVYCFTATTDWDKYEAIQSALLEHLAVAAADFGLGIYTNSSVTVELPAKA